MKEFAKWAAISALTVIGSMAFMVMAGDENPEQPMSVGVFLLVKAISMFILVGCLLTVRYMYQHGYMPDLLNRLAEEE